MSRVVLLDVSDAHREMLLASLERHYVGMAITEMRQPSRVFAPLAFVDELPATSLMSNALTGIGPRHILVATSPTPELDLSQLAAEQAPLKLPPLPRSPIPPPRNRHERRAALHRR